jgi:ABC-type lipoprotein release transport system permease subunit
MITPPQTASLNPRRLLFRGLAFYWRTHAAVVLGVATTVAVLSGALLVGDSVRGSLRDLVLDRIGRTDQVIFSSAFMREQLAQDLQSSPAFAMQFAGIAPIAVTQAFVSQQVGGGRAGRVNVYGVDDRFWRFHGVVTVSGPEGNDALISPALARELGAEPGAAILIRVQRPSDISLESLFANKDDLGSTMRAIVRAVVPRESLGEFSLQAQQGELRAVFLPLARLQRDLGLGPRVNALLVSAKPDATTNPTSVLAELVRTESELEDLGLRLRVLDARRGMALESDTGLLDDAKAGAATQVASEMGLQSRPVFTYLANTLRSGSREIPYSLVTATDLPGAPPIRTPSDALAAPDLQLPPITLTDWAARDLRVAAGATVTMEYYLWEEPGRLLTRTRAFRVDRVVPISTGDRELAPDYPGITDSADMSDWNPSFPIDLRRVRPADEAYWEEYRTTPKAFIPLSVGQQLWRSRYGAMTAIRLTAASAQPLETIRQEFAQRLRVQLDPLAAGLTVQNVRSESLAASRGATDFGEYFVYFSFFLVVSALLLAALFFKLGVEQRAREVGLLRAVGFKPADVARLFLSEGLLLSVAGAIAGVLGGLAYAWLIVAGLRTWWIGAVGTTDITLHISWVSLAGGALGGIAAATGCIWLTLRGMAAASERGLLAGQLASETSARGGARRKTATVLSFAMACAVVGAALLAASAAGLIASAGGFFGAGAAFLAASLFLFFYWFGRPVHKPFDGSGAWPVSHLGARNATYRPARSVLSVAMIASATFILLSVDAFRRDAGVAATDPHSGVGGYSLLVESLLPIVYDPNSAEGRRTLGLGEFGSVTVEPFRVRPGDDASCLNLYEPRNPRILAPTDAFLAAGRFAFSSSLASTPEERANPWLLLNREEPDGAVPVIADANSMTYILRRNLGDEIAIPHAGGTLRLRLVAALDDSIFQGELLMSQANFRRLFPEWEGYQVLLLETPPESSAAVATAVEQALTDFGAEVTPTAERLASFHQVENTYLSTFQMLGGLGLLLGTVGLGAVLLRNVLERRRELALLRALGYRQKHFFVMAIAENALLLVSGLVTGAVCAFLAIAPALAERGGRLPATALLLLLGAVLVAGLITSLVATAVALRSPLLAALREE